MAVEQTLALIKPDAMGAGLADDIRTRYLQNGLILVFAQEMTMTRDMASEFYGAHEGKHFFPELVEQMADKPIMALILEGEGAIERVRALNGATDPWQAEPGTIRHDFRQPDSGGPKNLAHASDSLAAFLREVMVLDLPVAA